MKRNREGGERTRKELTNFAFIDSQNIHLGIRRLGWDLDWHRFRIYLKEKYAVGTAYLFIGYLPENQGLYRALQGYGYVLIFKQVLVPRDGKPKGNVDADLVFQAMLDHPTYQRDPSYKKAVVVTSDGDFYSLVNHLYKTETLETVLSPATATCSVLLKKAARERIQFLAQLRGRLEYKKK